MNTAQAYPMMKISQRYGSLLNAQLAYFIHCSCDHQIPSPGTPERWVNVKIIDAAYESAHSGSVIQVE